VPFSQVAPLEAPILDDGIAEAGHGALRLT
jgi:hypothetical protein